MNILIYENNKTHNNYLLFLLDTFKKHLKEIEVINAENYKDFISIYSENHFDIVFIDTENDNGSQILNYLLETNLEQNIVIMNNDYECIDELSCNITNKNYNKYRIIKPINQEELIQILKNEKQDELFSNLSKELKILKIIEKQIDNYKLDLDKSEFIPMNNNFKEKILSSTLTILKMLDDHGIKYELLENYTIKLDL